MLDMIKCSTGGAYYARGEWVPADGNAPAALAAKGFDAAAVMALVDDEGQKVGVDENGNVTAKVTDADKKAKKVALQTEAVVDNPPDGSMLELPGAVSIYYSDGSARDTRGSLGGIEIEKWTDTDGIALSTPLAKKGTYKLVGKLKDVDNVTAIVYVTVSEAPRTITKLDANPVPINFKSFGNLFQELREYILNFVLIRVCNDNMQSGCPVKQAVPLFPLPLLVCVFFL